MKKNILLLFIPFLLLYSTTYYISNLGNNENDGKSESTSWRTISKLDSVINDYGLQNDDIIKFRQGDTFFGQINLLSNAPTGLRFTSYHDDNGTEKPIIDGSTSYFYFDKDDLKWDEDDQDNDDYGYELINGNRFYFIKGLDLSNGSADSTVYKVLNIYAGEEELIMARTPNENEPMSSFYYDSSHQTQYTGMNYLAEDRTYDYIPEVTGYNGGEFVIRNYAWQYSISKIIGTSLDEEISNMVQYSGYFIKNHLSCLNDNREWFFCYRNSNPSGPYSKLYFSTKDSNGNEIDDVWIYPVAYNKNASAGFGMRILGKDNYVIENIKFDHMKDCIYISGVNNNMQIRNCDFSNSIIGINCDSLSNGRIYGNNFTNLQSFGIVGKGSRNVIGRYDSLDNYSPNIFTNIGQKIGYDNKVISRWTESKRINLVGIEFSGTDNTIGWNVLSNIGYAGIKFSYIKQFENLCHKDTIRNNTITKALTTMSDGGGIYTWNNWGTGNYIYHNEVAETVGNNNGRPTNKVFGASGIYLDELSSNITVDNNTIYKCGGGIYLQNNRNNTITNNTVYNNGRFELCINHGGSILNGGGANPYNDPDFTPTTNLPSIYGSKTYYFDRYQRILQVGNNEGKVVYVEPGDNYIANNEIDPVVTDPIKDDSYRTFIFRTWRNVDETTIASLMGSETECTLLNNTIENTIPQQISVLFSSSDIDDYDIYKCNPLLPQVFQEGDYEKFFKYLGRVKYLNNEFNGININDYENFKAEIECGSKTLDF